MNNSTDKNVREFIDAINRDALEECKEIEKASEEFRKEEYEQAKARIKEEVDANKQYEITKILTETNRELSALVSEAKTEVVGKRNSITKEVFEKAEKKLVEFVKAEKYEGLIVSSAQKIKEALKSDEITFMLRSEDMKYADVIGEKLGGKMNFEEDSSIRIGGLKGKAGVSVADDTLDERLEEQKEWFKSHSELSLEI